MLLRQEVVITSGDTAVCVDHRAGRLRVIARELFSPDAVERARSFVDRVFQLDRVSAVRVGFRRGWGEIEYDPAGTTPADVLQTISRLLSQPRPGAASRCYHSVVRRRRTRRADVVRLERVRSTWVIVAERPGRMVVTHPQVFRRRESRRYFAARLAHEAGVQRARASRMGRSIVVHYEPSQLSRDQLLQTLKRLAGELDEQRWARAQAAAYVTEEANGLRRVVYRVLALSNLGMTCFALVMPAIPTPPFLAATIYFAMRSSPEIRDWLERSRTFGRLTRDWQQYRAVRTVVKIKSICITLVVMGAFVFLLGLSGPLLAVVLGMTTLQVVTILLLPSVRFEQRLIGADGT